MEVFRLVYNINNLSIRLFHTNSFFDLFFIYILLLTTRNRLVTQLVVNSYEIRDILDMWNWLQVTYLFMNINDTTEYLCV